MNDLEPAVAANELERVLALAQAEDCLCAGSSLPRIAMVSTHGYVAAQPPLVAADTGGQVVFVLELSRKLAQLGYEVDIWTRQFEDQPELEPVAEQVRGMTAVEAMTSGTPTLVTVHGGLARALTYGRHAMIADPLDKDDLGITMLKVFRYSRLRARLARMGAHKARSLFTWTGIAQQLIATVEQHPGASLVLADTEWDEPWNDAD